MFNFTHSSGFNLNWITVGQTLYQVIFTSILNCLNLSTISSCFSSIASSSISISQPILFNKSKLGNFHQLNFWFSKIVCFAGSFFSIFILWFSSSSSSLQSVLESIFSNNHLIFLGDFSILIFLGVSSNSNCSSFFVIFVGFETSFFACFLDGFTSSSSSTELSFHKDIFSFKVCKSGVNDITFLINFL